MRKQLHSGHSTLMKHVDGQHQQRVSVQDQLRLLDLWNLQQELWICLELWRLSLIVGIYLRNDGLGDLLDDLYLLVRTL